MDTVLKPIRSLERDKDDIDIEFEVVTCFIDWDDKFLVLQRARRDEQFGLWGIPGGKLEDNEEPRQGLAREIFEETNISIWPNNFQFLEKAHSINRCDGSYLLYLYYVKLGKQQDVNLNKKEHSGFQWVSLDNFSKLSLLVSQGAAFNLVKEKLKKITKYSDSTL